MMSIQSYVFVLFYGITWALIHAFTYNVTPHAVMTTYPTVHTGQSY